MKRRLSLSTEHLAELSTDELGAVAGGIPTQVCTGRYPTFDYLCTKVTDAINVTVGCL